MKKVHPLIAAAFLVHAVAWFSPVAEGGVTFPYGLPGWEAFYMACLTAAIPPWYNAVLSAMGALSTALFVLGAGWVVAKGSARVRRVSAWIAACAFVVNAHWIRGFVVRSDRFGVKIGYFLWWVSFLLLAIGLFLEKTPEREGKAERSGVVFTG